QAIHCDDRTIEFLNHDFVVFCLINPPPPTTPPFPYTTLFRSANGYRTEVWTTKRVAEVKRPSTWPAITIPLANSSIGSTGHPKKDRKSTRLNSSHLGISYAVFCLKKKNLTRP